ncbi:hypothetical protein AVEN_7868-1 [Araneus ventricosus]|uniref:Uncharacterized protein n=1 Tax=Araneus ventricosus TaxID=182803 RepID=A0A4Y2MGR0_ARAVE|nr:hypothetical protein AVEN_7868-1 [Araneus ventricosus]
MLVFSQLLLGGYWLTVFSLAGSLAFTFSFRRRRRDVCVSRPVVICVKCSYYLSIYDEADRLEKEAAESDRDPLSVKAPISFLKSLFKKKVMEDLQSDWKDEDTGRSTFNILPRVSTQPCYWKRGEILFFTGHGPFPSYLKKFNLASIAKCPCGNTNGTPLHYAAECILTASFHMTKPAQQHELIWFGNVASNKCPDLKSNYCYTILMIFMSFFE